MPKAKEKVVIDATTEEKIKNAARIVFQHKGLAAARTRDIAEAADVNLALLNYYFRSKEKLFEIIMYETLINFSKGITVILNDESTSIDEKIALLVNDYSEMLINEPNIPLFILSEMRNRPEDLFQKIPVKQLLSESAAVKLFFEKISDGGINDANTIHFLINLLSLTIFPFVSRPIVKTIGNFDDLQFNKMMEKRKKLIPIWIKAIMEV